MKLRLTKIIYWGAIAIGLIFLASRFYPVLSDFFETEYQAITFPYSIDYGEGPLLDQTLRLAQFQNIYRNTFDNPPYTISNYPPLFPLIQVPFAWIFGPAYWYGRLIDFICVLLAVLFVALTLYTLTADWTGSVIAGLLLLASPYIQHWAHFDRVDELALALSWAGVFVIVRGYSQTVPPLADPPLADPHGTSQPALSARIRQRLSYRPLWIGVLLLVAAIFTRQTYALTAPAAVTIWLVLGAPGAWKDRFLRAALFAGLLAGISLLLFLALDLATAGGFYLNIVVANVNAFDWQTVSNYANEIKDKLWPLLALTGGFLLFGAIGRPARTRSAWALAAPYAISAAASAVTIGKDGSNVNYLLELAAALSLAAGAALAWASQWQRWPVKLALQLACIGLLAFQCSTLPDWINQLSISYLQEQTLYRLNTQRMVQMIEDTPGIVLADEYMGLLPLAGKTLYLQPFEFKALSDAHVWDQTPFLQQIAAHKFDFILWYESSTWQSVEGRWTVAQRAAIEKYYVEDQLIGDVHVMTPRK